MTLKFKILSPAWWSVKRLAIQDFRMQMKSRLEILQLAF